MPPWKAPELALYVGAFTRVLCKRLLGALIVPLRSVLQGIGYRVLCGAMISGVGGVTLQT